MVDGVRTLTHICSYLDAIGILVGRLIRREEVEWEEKGKAERLFIAS